MGVVAKTGKNVLCYSPAKMTFLFYCFYVLDVDFLTLQNRKCTVECLAIINLFYPKLHTTSGTMWKLAIKEQIGQIWLGICIMHCPFLNTVKKFSRLGALNLLDLEADKNFSTFPLFRQKIALSSRSLTAGMVLTFLFWKRCRIRLIRCKESHNSWVAYQLSQNPNFKCPFVKLFRHFIKKST